MFTEVDVYEFQSALHLCVVLNSTVATQVVIEVTTQSGTATGMEFTLQYSLCYVFRQHAPQTCSVERQRYL